MIAVLSRLYNTVSKVSTLPGPSCTLYFVLFLLNGIKNKKKLTKANNYLFFRSFKCGGVLTGVSGFIGSEGFPGVYPPNSKCTWKITVRTFEVTNHVVKNSMQLCFVAVPQGMQHLHFVSSWTLVVEGCSTLVTNPVFCTRVKVADSCRGMLKLAY